MNYRQFTLESGHCKLVTWLPELWKRKSLLVGDEISLKGDSRIWIVKSISHMHKSQEEMKTMKRVHSEFGASIKR